MFNPFWQVPGMSSASLSAVLMVANGAVATEFPEVERAQQQSILVTEQFLSPLKHPAVHPLSSYSLKAADLQLAPTSPVDKSQSYLYNPAPEARISETINELEQQPDNLPIVQNQKPETEASEAKPDKSRYNLFNPTPRNLLREFATDRPDTTESPFTVDAGHFQFEADLVNFSRRGSDEDGNTTEDLLFASTNLKIGLLNNVDLQLVVQPYHRSRIEFSDTKRVEQTAGFDVLVPRVKVNIYGNDSSGEPGSTALAIMPFISIPTVRNGIGGNFVEGGLIIPFAINLSDKFALALMTEFDLVKNAKTNSYHVEYVNTASLGYTLTDKLDTYFEIATRFDNESRFGGIVTFNTGLIFDLGNDLQLDGGINVGLTRASDDIRTFVGLSKRF